MWFSIAHFIICFLLYNLFAFNFFYLQLIKFELSWSLTYLFLILWRLYMRGIAEGLVEVTCDSDLAARCDSASHFIICFFVILLYLQFRFYNMLMNNDDGWWEWLLMMKCWWYDLSLAFHHGTFYCVCYHIIIDLYHILLSYSSSSKEAFLEMSVMMNESLM